jgi:hypothetical protein
MGRSRKSGAMAYDLTVSRDAFNALSALAQERQTTLEEVVREQLLNNPEYKERLIPRARRMLRHATITVQIEDGEAS